MQVQSVISAQAIRFIDIRRETFYVPDVVRVLVERYGFAKIPRAPEELLPATGSLMFEHGKFTRPNCDPIIVQSLQVFAQVAVANTFVSTDDSEAFLTDAIEWATEAGVIRHSEPRRMYISQLELKMDLSLERCFPVMNDVGRAVGEALKFYDSDAPPLGVFSVAMTLDPTKVKLPSEFRFERRVDVPYELNTYFSQAPLKTAEHISVLETLEKNLQAVIEQS